MFAFRITFWLLAFISYAYAEEIEEDNLSVSERLERANSNIVRGADEPFVVDDIAYESESVRNADPCTSRGCMWPKSSDGKVYVPYVIANHYTSRELSVIQRGLDSFSSSTCIRFVRRNNQREYLSIQSHNGCYSYVGRLGNGQTLSLSRQGCIYHNTVQHELLHALGFNHEQCRSDRDQYIRVLLQNVQSGLEYAFDKIATLNQGTPYDYNSVMQYHKYAFSKNNQPTMVPYPDPNVPFATATEMTKNDILRVNRLYKC
ncbi:low choriolytic enzyme-like [Clupea harengus]|uniref:Metalloendopeptidase n=1 Tax=Clupea harengus TaxID=7950 RepID=A0A6P8FBI0_CLUHA|nr:low choriolytic enzyme-like [Clupea harengus]